MNPTDEILKSKDCEFGYGPESDYGQAEIWFKNESIFCLKYLKLRNPRLSTL
jgi:hypothetical protein